MSNFFLEQKFTALFPHVLTPEQAASTARIAKFLTSPANNEALLFKGYAGTGKTTMLATVVRMMAELRHKTVLMAPTGRAAKVFAGYAGFNAFTVHRKIYRRRSDPAGGFELAPNLHKDTLFIVDEASMLANDHDGIAAFGSGRLLDDLINYIFNGDNCRLILAGDDAQLPPVGLNESPALNPTCLKQYNLNITELQLTQVVRQEETSGILFNATAIRKAIRTCDTQLYPQLRTGFLDFKLVNGEDFLEELTAAYARDGIDDTIVICRSNKAAGIYNNGIRNRILCREEEISRGDRLMVVKNNYSFGKQDIETDFIANGEILSVIRVRHTEELYGLRFCNIQARFDSYDAELEVKLLLDVLACDTPALPKELADNLYAEISSEYETATKTERTKRMRENPFLNALQVKYAYAVTCHKAQGGQWSNVFIDTGFVSDDMLGEDFYRWLYTAITRATKRIVILNRTPNDHK
jgi:exodeoxyribonuclease-5